MQVGHTRCNIQDKFKSNSPVHGREKESVLCCQFKNLNFYFLNCWKGVFVSCLLLLGVMFFIGYHKKKEKKKETRIPIKIQQRPLHLPPHLL